MTRNNADFHGVTFTHQPASYGETLVQAHHPDHGVIGHLLIGAFHNVRNIMVNPEHQRKGVATGMWNYAKQQGLEPEHSDIRTEEGTAWAKSTGDDVPGLTMKATY